MRSRTRKARIVYPADGKLMGDWQKGERLAQSGYGLRFTDYPPRQANGGNCYACPDHQAGGELRHARRSLLRIRQAARLQGRGRQGNLREDPQFARALACSTMPRFGANKILTIEQINDAVALLMSPDSPVNKGQ